MPVNDKKYCLNIKNVQYGVWFPQITKKVAGIIIMDTMRLLVILLVFFSTVQEVQSLKQIVVESA